MELTVFSLSIPYWPAESAIYWWENFRRDEVTRDFQLAASLHLRHLSVSLLWSDFQPDPGRLALTALHSLETTLTVAEDFQMQLSIVVFPVKQGDLLCAPSWALADLDHGAGRTLTGHSLSRRPLRDVFRDPVMLQAEAFFVREIVHAFTDHPAIAGWVLGEHMSAATAPGTRPAFEEWIGTLAESARASRCREPLWHAVSARDLIESAFLEPGSLAPLDVRLRVADDWRPWWARGGGETWQAFLVGYATCLSGHPAVITNLGSCAGDEESHLSGTTRDQRAAEALERVVPLLAGVGGGGGAGTSLFDFSASLAASPPFDREPRLLDSGCFRRDGTIKQTGRVWSDLFDAGLEVQSLPGAFPSPNLNERRARPEAVARECFEAFSA